MPGEKSVTAESTASQLKASYGVPRADEALGLPRRQLGAVLTTALSGEVQRRCTEISQVLTTTAAAFSNYAAVAGEASLACTKAADRHDELGADIDARLDALLAAKSAALWATTPEDTNALVDQMTVVTADFSNLDQSLGEMSTVRPLLEQNVAEANNLLRKQLEERDRALGIGAVQSDLDDSTALADLLYALHQEAKFAHAYQHALKGPAFVGYDPNLFSVVEHAALGASSVIESSVVKAAKVRLGNPRTGRGEEPEFYLGALDRVRSHMAEMDAAGAQLRKAVDGGLSLPKEAVQELQQLLRALQVDIEELAVGNLAHRNFVQRHSATLRELAAESHYAGEVLQAEASILADIDSVWSPAVAAATELRNIVNQAEQDHAGARRQIARIEHAMTGDLRRRLNAGDIKLLQRLGLRTMPASEAAQQAVVKAALKQETFAMAYGEQALARLVVAHKDDDEPVARANHGREVMVAINEMRQAAPKPKAQPSAGIENAQNMAS